MKKYLVVICDGMSDLPIDSLGGKTPLEYANTPNMDFIASNGISGMARTVPIGMTPGSDTANLSIFGYNPEIYYTGRAPLEALNMGLHLEANDAAFRCNIVSLEKGQMKDFTANHIESALSEIIIHEFNKINEFKNIKLYPGVSYRNIMLWHSYPYKRITQATPPHDISNCFINESHNPQGDGADVLLGIQEMSKKLIAENHIIKKAMERYKGNPASFWIWGGGKKPTIESFYEKYNLKGNTISAVDLINGIGRAADLLPIAVPGVTAYIDTNYLGKASAAITALENTDIVFIHIESPDESGHEGNLQHKLMSIEDIDSIVIKHILENVGKFEDWTILVMPDHPTPISTRTHTPDPVPFCILSKNGIKTTDSYKQSKVFSEKEAQMTGVYVDDASTIIQSMIDGLI